MKRPRSVKHVSACMLYCKSETSAHAQVCISNTLPACNNFCFYTCSEAAPETQLCLGTFGLYKLIIPAPKSPKEAGPVKHA